MKTFFKNKIFTPLVDLLRQGITPEKFALSVALGFMIGIIPMVGVSTAICALLAMMFDINIVAIQIMNYIAYPLQLLFYIPFIKAGGIILGQAVSASGSSAGLKNIFFNEGFTATLKTLCYANMQGLLVWLMITLPLTPAIYYIFLLIFRSMGNRVPAGE